MVPKIDYKRRDGLCRVGKVKVSVDARVTLPSWRGRANASEELGKAWDNIDRYTRLHEAVHVAMAFKYAKRMETEIAALPARPMCSQVNKDARSLYTSLLAEHDASQRQFDADEQSRLSAMVRERRSKG